MSQSTTRPTIVVGVTAPGDERAALAYAAACAQREGAEVVLAHAFHAVHPAAPQAPLVTYAQSTDVARWVVKEVAEEFEELSGGVPFRTLVVDGSPAKALADLSTGARLVVVQHRPGRGLARLVQGSTAYGLAAHAACPVVSVDRDWTPARAAGEVVIGVHEGGGPAEILEEGFRWAAGTGAAVRVVHAWRLDDAYADIVTERVAETWVAEEKDLLRRAVRDVESRYPDVPVVLEVRHHWPADVLVDDSRNASLVVLGRHGTRPWTPGHVGSIARTVLRVAACPVMVVPPPDPAHDGWGMTDDEVSPQT